MTENGSSLKQLSFKLIVLLALTTGQSGQTLHCIKVPNIENSSEYVKIRIKDLLKSSKPGNHLAELYIQQYPQNKSLCVVDTLNKYLDYTERLRGDETRLFISYQRPHKSVTNYAGEWNIGQCWR